jgi:hypothetical protein
LVISDCDNTTSDNAKSDNATSDNATSDNATSDNATLDNITNRNKIDVAQYNSDVVNEDGSVNDYSSEMAARIADSESIIDGYDKNIEKANLTKEWINNIDEEINYRNEQLKYADDTEKSIINERINELNNNKATQQITFNEYLSAAKIEKEKSKTANLTANNLNAEEDDFSNLKYNNKYNYKSNQSKSLLNDVTALKQEAAQLDEESEIIINSVANMSSPEEKTAAVAKSEDLDKQSQKKQNEIAKIYENANRNEFYNNESILSNLTKANKDPYSDNVILAEMLSDESVSFYERAAEEREKAQNASSFTSREINLQKAYQYEMKAIEKQNEAIRLYTKSGDEELLTIANSQNPTTERTSNDNGTNEASNNNTTSNDTEQLVDNATSNNSNVVESYSVYEPLAIGLPSADIIAKAKRLEKEAEVLNIEATILTDSAETVRKKKEKEPLITKANELKEEAQRKIKEAEVLYTQADEMKSEEEELTQELSNNRIAIGNEKLTEEETNLVVALPVESVLETTNSDNYKNYAETKKQTRRLIKEAQVEYIEADKKQQEAADQKTLEISLKAMASGAQNAADKEKILSQLEQLNDMIEENENKAAELRKSATNKEKQALENTKKTDYILINSPEEEAQNITAIEKVEAYNSDMFNKLTSDDLASNARTSDDTQDPVVEDPVVEDPVVEDPVVEDPVVEDPVIETPVSDDSSDNQLVNVDEIPTVLNQSIFRLNNNQAAYSNDKPIPVSPKLPEGLVFKVQIGAFRNPIPQNHFKGFTPIMAEDAGNGITRYTAGFFKSFNMANEAKSSIRSIGYSDAFVVAFYNGKRINITEARAMLNDNQGAENIISDNNSLNDNSTSTDDNSTSTSDNSVTNNVPDTEEVIDGVSTDVRNIDGVFFTIQVGVYSKPVTANQLNNVTPLNSERTASGLIRYTSGIYKTLEEANVAKERIRNLGITDAFVVAYNGGEKITIAKANEMLGTTINSVEDPVVEDPVVEDPVVEDLNIEYKVQLGEYEEDVPVEDAGIFLKLTGRGVKNFEENNKTIYTIGSYPDYQSALDLQIEMKEEGVKNPKVIAFKDGVKITVEEALELQKNN